MPDRPPPKKPPRGPPKRAPRDRDDDDRGAPRGPRSQTRERTERLHGVRAVLAAFAARPKDVGRLWLTRSNQKELKPIVDYCARHQLRFHVTDEEEISKVSAVQRHEGVCLEIARPPKPTLDDALAAMKTAPSALWVALEDVGDPHNVGAIVRSCGHFGVDALLGLGRTARRNPALVRTSEGAAERVPLVSLERPMDALRKVRRAGFTVVATSPHATRSIFDLKLPRRTMFALGAERTGLSDAVVGASDELVSIPGSGDIESLNVACAATVLLAEAWRQRPKQP